MNMRQIWDYAVTVHGGPQAYVRISGTGYITSAIIAQRK